MKNDIFDCVVLLIDIFAIFIMICLAFGGYTIIDCMIAVKVMLLFIFYQAIIARRSLGEIRNRLRKTDE